MSSSTGTSILGRQLLINAASASTRQLSIALTGQPLPPIKRLGYFYLYQYNNVAPNQHWVVDEGLVRAPGEWITISVPQFGSYLFRLEVVWNLPGQAWSVNTA